MPKKEEEIAAYKSTVVDVAADPEGVGKWLSKQDEEDYILAEIVDLTGGKLLVIVSQYDDE